MQTSPPSHLPLVVAMSNVYNSVHYVEYLSARDATLIPRLRKGIL